MQGVLEAFLAVDEWLMRAGNMAAQNSAFDFLMPLFDKGYYWWAPIALTVIGVLIFGSKRGAWAALAAIIIVALTDQIGALLKDYFGRIRPCNVLAGVHLWKDGGWLWLPDPVVDIYRASYSFPSNHAANTAGQAVWWGWIYPRARWWAIGFSGLVGYSRVYDGVHWPMDVIGGWALGAFVAGGMIWMTLVIKNRRRKRLQVPLN